MALLANVALTDTFDTWRTVTNQHAQLLDVLIEGGHLTTGTITSTNTGAAINVSAGYILVGANTFASNAVALISNTGTIGISGIGELGTNLYIDVLDNGQGFADQSNANVAHANVVNALSSVVVKNYITSNGAFYHANSTYDVSNGAFYHANTAYNVSNGAFYHANASFNLANNNLANVNASFHHANAAFDLANTIDALSGNQATLIQKAWQTGNSAFEKANAANVLAFTTGTWSNTKTANVFGTSGRTTVTYSTSGGYNNATVDLSTAGAGAATYTKGIYTVTVDAYGRVTSVTQGPQTGNNGGTTSGTITPTGDTVDQYDIIGLTGTVTIAAPSGTPTHGQKLTLRLKDNGTSRTVNWTTSAGGYRVIGAILPTSTTAGKVTYVGCIYNSTDGYWDVVAVATQI